MKQRFTLHKTDEAVVLVDSGTGERLELALGELAEDVVRRAAVHGLAQKLASALAAPRGTPPEERWARAQQVAAALRAGRWTRGARGRASDADLAAAVAEVAGIDPAEAVARIARLSADQRRALRRHPRVAAELARITAARVGGGPPLEDILGV